MKLTSKLIAFAMTLSLCTSFFAGCAPKAIDADASSIADQSIDVQIAYPESKNLSRETEFMGRVESGNSVNIYAEVPAKIIATHKNLGEFVLEGELLMEVDDTDMQTALLTAQSGLATAQLNKEKTKAQSDITVSGSGYITKQLTNGKTLSDLVDSYYDTLRGTKQLNNSYDEYTSALWTATSNRTKAEGAFNTANASTHAAIAQWLSSGKFPGIDSDGLMAYMKDEASSTLSNTISSILDSDNALRKAFYSVQVAYKNAANALTAATTGEKSAKAALTAYESQYDTSMSTIDSSIRKITKNYDYYAKTYDVADTLGVEETRMLNELTQATLQLSCDSAQRSVDTARRNLDKCKIYAPVSGIIITKNAVTSNFANAAQPMYVISSDEATPVIAFNVSEDGADVLTVGSAVTAVINEQEYPATITEIANSTTAGSGLFAAKAVLPADSDISRSGTVVKVKASTAEADNVLTLPLNIIEYDENQPYVLVYRNKKAVRCDLELGMATHEDVQILSGVTAKDAVITTWHPELRNGSNVSCAALEGGADAKTNDIEVVK